MVKPILEIERLKTQFFTRDGVVRAVDGVSYSIYPGETLGVVGESGCGKSVTALSVLRLIARPGRIVEGEIRLSGKNLLNLSEPEMRDIRGNEISMIFQEPMTSLNPVLTVGWQIAETLMLHQKLSRRDAFDKAIEMLKTVRIPEPERRVRDYPFRLSGGMRQRVMIAMALSCNPKVMLADEPTTALDVTIQAQVLQLMQELKDRLGTAIVLITHDLGLIAETAQRVVVMYAGRKVEEAPVEALFERPRHPYTLGLMRSLPRLNKPSLKTKQRERLSEIPGMLPALTEIVPGCNFAPRCTFSVGRCRTESPPLEEHAQGHWSACFQQSLVVEAAS
jgi:peptide/nickel transport system ATP-binding protein